MEMMVIGWFYLKTSSTNVTEATKEFREACEEVGINADNISSVVIRDEDGNDITDTEVVW